VNGLLSGEYSRMTDAEGRFTISGLSSRLFDGDDPHRVVMAISSPGLPYLPAVVTSKRDSDTLIESVRGIPCRLRLADEPGQPVAAKVTYRDVQPNPHLPRVPHLYESSGPMSLAAHRGGRIDEGLVFPGPGAVLVRMPPRASSGPASVNPKAFFAPGRTDWTDLERRTSYGTSETLSSGQGQIKQHEYAAIVLVNPPKDPKPLELSATVVKD